MWLEDNEGDYWGIDEKIPDFYSPEGNSLVLIHTSRGEKMWNSIKDNLEWVKSKELDCLQPNLIRPTPKSPYRDKFWRDYKKRG